MAKNLVIRNGFIEDLGPEDIFVFGSNLAGRHGRGAAATAAQRFGARHGVGEGLTGSSYALPTKDEQLRVLPMERIAEGLQRLGQVAERAPAKTFYLTRVGQGLAGLHEREVRSLVEGVTLPKNVSPWWQWENGPESGRTEQLLHQPPNQGVIATPRQGWSNRPGSGYEVSSRGDKRFSALYARLPDGRTIEDAWGQAKGYADGRSAKGKPALTPGLDYWGTYKGLWEQWAAANPGLIDELAVASQGQPLVDRFARTENNQARALAEILASRTPLATPRMAGDALIAAAAAPTGPIWAFGGARATPPDVLELISQIGKKHAENGGRIVHGGAPGADRAASRLVTNPEALSIFLPGPSDPRGPDPQYAGGRVFDVSRLPTWEQAHAIARQYEDPYRPGGRNYNARNVMVLLGPRLDAPREKFVVWSLGSVGTKHATSTAEGHGIPVRNLADPAVRAAAERWLES